MKPSTQAMIWYFWRLSRRNLLIFVMASASIASIFVTADEAYMTLSAQTNIVIQIVFLALLGGFLFSGRGGWSGLPNPYLATLPVSTKRCLSAAYGVQITLVVAACGAMTAFHLLLFGTFSNGAASTVGMAFWQIPIFCVGLGCLAHSASHLSPIKNEFRVVPMAIAIEAMAFAIILPQLRYGRMNVVYGLLITAASVALAWACSQNALTAHRHGVLRNGIPALLEWLARGDGRTRAFASPNRALFWLGWKRFGSIFPFWALAVTLIGVLFTAVYLMAYDRRNPFSDNSGFAGLMSFGIPLMVLSAALASHVALAMRVREDFFGAGRAFFLTLPSRSSTLARGPVLAATLSVALVIAALTITHVTLAAAGVQSVFDRHIMPVAFVYVLAVWLLFWFGSPLIPGYFVFLAIHSVLSFFRNGPYSFLDVEIMATASFLAMAFFLCKGVLRRRMAAPDLLLFTASLLFPTFAVTANALGFTNTTPYLMFLQFGIFLSFALPFAAGPVVMHWIRHR
jgi:hypothetical protein